MRYSSASTPSATSSENSRKISGAATTAMAVSTVSAIERHRHDHRRRLVVVLLGLLGEHRHQRRRQHAAEQQLVDRVRRVVGAVVRVGERRLADDDREDRDPQQSGDARQRRAERDGDVALEQAAHVAEAEVPGPLWSKPCDRPVLFDLVDGLVQRLQLGDHVVDGRARARRCVDAGRHLGGLADQLAQPCVQTAQPVVGLRCAPRERGRPSRAASAATRAALRRSRGRSCDCSDAPSS